MIVRSGEDCSMEMSSKFATWEQSEEVFMLVLEGEG